MVFRLGVHPIVAFGVTDIDDKIIQKSISLKETVHEVAEYYTNSFFQDLRRLNVKPPTHIARVTENTNCIFDDIEYLYSNGRTTTDTDGTLRFDICRHLSNHKFGYFQKGEGQNFALWRPRLSEFSIPSPWGDGIPGWHIECFSMAKRFLGKELDLHFGGCDLKYPHHENEMAIGNSILGDGKWCNGFYHIGLVEDDSGEKMSKSQNNFTTIREFLESYSPNVLRLLLLSSQPHRSIKINTDKINFAANLNSRLESARREIVKTLTAGTKEALPSDSSVELINLY